MNGENIKKENGASVKSEMIVDIKDEPGLLWEGEVRFKSEEKREVRYKTEERSKEIKAVVQIFHKDDSKNGCRLFNWTSQGKL